MSKYNEVVKVRCVHCYDGNGSCNNPEYPTCVNMFGKLIDRNEQCMSFTIDWVKFILYRKHLEIIKDE